MKGEGLQRALADRLSKLQHQSLGKNKSNSSNEGCPEGRSMHEVLRGRLSALAAASSPPHRGEESYRERLAALTNESDSNTITSAESLADRLRRLSSNPRPAASSSEPIPQQADRYHVPKDFCDDSEDLDDLLSNALLERAEGSKGLSLPSESQTNAKLREVDALLRSEAALIAAKEVAGSRTYADAGLEVDKAMDAFLGARGGAPSAVSGPQSQDSLGDDERRLLQMVTEQVRLEGHGVVAQVCSSPHGKAGDLWLPEAPTAPPIVRPIGGDPGAGVAIPPASASLVAQQALDEARMNLGVEDGETASETSVRAQEGRSAAGDVETGEESWCCICSEDAVLRCADCEAEQNIGDPELFCGRCFKEVHRGDPDMEAHQPKATSRTAGRSSRTQEGRSVVFRHSRQRR